jgi:hypothetical protein
MLPKEDRDDGMFVLAVCAAGLGRLLGIVTIVCALILAKEVKAQSKGVYPLGMSATNSGITPESGFTYSNQLLFYSRDEVKDQNGSTTRCSFPAR